MKCGIIGCGYLGIELAWQLATNGHQVVGVRRSPDGVEDLRDAGYQGIRSDVTDPDTLGEIPAVDVVIYMVSPGRSGDQSAEDVYQRGLENTIRHFCRHSVPDRFIYVSSTGVYGDHDGGWVTESTEIEPSSDRQKLLLDAESLVFELTSDVDTRGTVIRLAGLYGPHRYRLRSYLRGPVLTRYSNLIHRDDAAGIIRYLIESNQGEDEVILGVDNLPVSKWKIAAWISEAMGEEPPGKQSIEDRLQSEKNSTSRARIGANKRCSNEKLLELGYRYKYRTFREGYSDIINSYLA